MQDERLAGRCRALKLVLSDVDGVMTDGSLLLLSDGSEAKSFNVRDGLGIVMAHAAGLRTGVLSGRSDPAVERRARELGMAIALQGVADKGAALDRLLEAERLEPHEVAYVGDDLNDLPVLTRVGLSGAPADASFEVRQVVFMVLSAAGGRGCLREFIEAILRARGDFDRVAAGVGLRLP